MKEGSPIYPNVKAIWCIENCKKKKMVNIPNNKTLYFSKSLAIHSYFRSLCLAVILLSLLKNTSKTKRPFRPKGILDDPTESHWRLSGTCLDF